MFLKVTFLCTLCFFSILTYGSPVTKLSHESRGMNPAKTVPSILQEIMALKPGNEVRRFEQQCKPEIIRSGTSELPSLQMPDMEYGVWIIAVNEVDIWAGYSPNIDNESDIDWLLTSESNPKALKATLLEDSDDILAHMSILVMGGGPRGQRAWIAERLKSIINQAEAIIKSRAPESQISTQLVRLNQGDNPQAAECALQVQLLGGGDDFTYRVQIYLSLYKAGDVPFMQQDFHFQYSEEGFLTGERFAAEWEL